MSYFLALSEVLAQRANDAAEWIELVLELPGVGENLHDQPSLDAARKLGDYFVSTIGPGKAEFWPSSYRPPQNVNTIVCDQFVWVPPNTPKDRVQILRRGFLQTMKDADFLGDANKANLEIAPASGEEIEQLIQNMFKTPSAVVAGRAD